MSAQPLTLQEYECLKEKGSLTFEQCEQLKAFLHPELWIDLLTRSKNTFDENEWEMVPILTPISTEKKVYDWSDAVSYSKPLDPSSPSSWSSLEAYLNWGDPQKQTTNSCEVHDICTNDYTGEPQVPPRIQIP
jgi:hypothetical protein